MTPAPQLAPADGTRIGRTPRRRPPPSGTNRGVRDGSGRHRFCDHRGVTAPPTPDPRHSPPEPPTPTEIDVDRAALELRLVWNDGRRGALSLVDVRLRCPCATCRHARQSGRESWPRPGSPQPLGVTGAELVGAFGLSITWNDGHSEGIYPFALLSRWTDLGVTDVDTDSGL